MADDASTRFPFINLEKALTKAKLIFDGDRTGKAMPVATAFELWGYSPKSSGGFQTTGALKYYGLLEDEGSKDERKVKLTERARHYFLDERDEQRAAMLADFALRPALFRGLWKRDGWSEGIPADTVARSHLKLARNLNDQSARSALAIFKENIQFAGLKPSSVPSPSLSDLPGESSDEMVETKPRGELSDVQGQSTGSNSSGLQREMVMTAEPPTVIAGLPFEARISGNRVIITANVDLQGLRRLKKRIDLLEQMLALDDDETVDAR